MALHSEALTTVPVLRDYLTRHRTAQVSGTLSDDELERLINAASSAIGTYCARRLIVQSTDETAVIDGDGTAEIRLIDYGYYPIVSITSITNYHTGAIAARSNPDSTGYLLGVDEKLRGVIRLDGYSTDSGMGTVTIVGTWGYSEAVAGGTAGALQRAHRQGLTDLEQACLLWCAARFQNPVPGQQTVAVAGLTMSFNPRRVPTEVEGLLIPYRRPTA